MKSRFAQEAGFLASFPDNLDAGPGAKDYCSINAVMPNQIKKS